MILPNELKLKVQELFYGQSLTKIAQESASLSSHYRDARISKKKLDSLSSHYQRLAYLMARMPATYAVIVKILEGIVKLSGEGSPVSLLDIGAGPGTALFAAKEVFPCIHEAVLIERDAEFIRLGKQLAEYLNPLAVKWREEDLKKFEKDNHYDLIIASYSLGELEEGERLKLLSSLWDATGQFLVIIEPGTPFGFSQIKQMREFLILKDAHLLAPCPHAAGCPLPSNDWCHFSARVERSSEHRKIKLAQLNYEDEKFSYLVFSKNPIARCQERILRHPMHQPGCVKLQVCCNKGIIEKTVTKKNKIEFSTSKKLKCGDFI